jgi:predicted transcriptional regulator
MQASRAEILAALGKEHQPITSCDLARKMERRPSNVSAVLSKLGSYGKVARKALIASNGRATLVYWLPPAPAAQQAGAAP